MEENAGGSTAPGEGFLSRMALNDNKAGMEGLDRDKINKIILETSKGSRFYENELKKERQVNLRIERMMLQKAEITEQQLKKAQTQVEKLSADLESGRQTARVIVHVDMDAFFAAVEMRDCPELKDKPMAVGGMSMLSTSNYHARRFGVRAAMPGFIAKKLCPNLVIVPVNFSKYRAVSAKVREVFAVYDPNFLPMSLDEAYLDISEHLELRQSWPESMRTHRVCPGETGAEDGDEEMPPAGEETDGLSPVLFEDSPSVSPTLPEADGSVVVFGTSAEEAVREMRFRIEQKTSLTASAGIAPNMMLAKVCSDKNKPNGQYRIPPDRQAVMDFIRDLPVRKVSGIGKVTERMLGALGISSCAQLGQRMALLCLLFSETAWHHFLQISLGLGSTHVESDGERKSMSTERTFAEMGDAEEQYSLCRELCHDLAQDLQKEGLKGKTVTLKLKNVNFEVKTRAFTLQCAVSTADEVFAAAKDLLKTEMDNVRPQPLRLRLMGVRVSGFIGVEYKKPLQRSIVGFLHSGGSDPGCSVPHAAPGPGAELDSQAESCPGSVQTLSAAAVPGGPRGPEDMLRPLSRWGAGGPQQQSFFQRAHAQRLQQQAAQAAVVSSPTEPRAPVGRAATDAAPGETSATSADSLVMDAEADATTSANAGCVAHASPSMSSSSATHTPPSFICPVCFQERKTGDLRAFNQHIDECLSSNLSGQVDVDEGQGRGRREEEEEERRALPESVHRRVTESRARASPEQLQQQPSSAILPSAVGDRRSTLGPNSASLFGEKSGNAHFTFPPHSDGGRYSEEGGSRAPDGRGMRSPDPGGGGPALTCPVCDEPQDTGDLTLFNRHVDLCLNQEVLLEFRGAAALAADPHSGISAPRKVKGRAEVPQRAPRGRGRGKSKRQGSSPPPPSKKTKAVGSRNTIDKFFR